MATTYSTAALGLPRNRVRLLIPDTQASPNHVFEDEEIDAFLSLGGSNVRLAAAQALEVIASSEALKLKVLKVGDITTDGAKLSDALLARAKALRDEVAEGDPDDADSLPFAIAEQAHGIFGGDQVRRNEIARGVL
jgi:hypothetical protein